MKKELILERLKNDEDYYGAFGRKYLSNSNVGTLLTNPLALRDTQQPNINFLIGGYSVSYTHLTLPTNREV